MNGEEIFHIELDRGIQWQGSKVFSYSLSRANLPDSALVITELTLFHAERIDIKIFLAKKAGK